MHKTENYIKSTNFTIDYIQHQPNDERNPNLHIRNPHCSGIIIKTKILCISAFFGNATKKSRLVRPLNSRWDPLPKAKDGVRRTPG